MDAISFWAGANPWQVTALPLPSLPFPSQLCLRSKFHTFKGVLLSYFKPPDGGASGQSRAPRKGSPRQPSPSPSPYPRFTCAAYNTPPDSSNPGREQGHKMHSTAQNHLGKTSMSATQPPPPPLPAGAAGSCWQRREGPVLFRTAKNCWANVCWSPWEVCERGCAGLLHPAGPVSPPRSSRSTGTSARALARPGRPPWRRVRAGRAWAARSARCPPATPH